MNNNNNFKSPVECFKHWVQHCPDKVYLRQPEGDQWHTLSWKQANEQVCAMAASLARFPEGSRIAIYSLNCAHWILADLAILMAGHISVPIYPTANQKTVSQIMDHSGSCAIFIGKLPVATQLPVFNEKVECFSFFSPRENTLYWDEMVAESIKQGLRCPEVEVNEQDLLTLVYTSGTTGQPKGVMLPYRAIFKAIECVGGVIKLTEDEKYFSYLPLAHIAERMVVEMNSLYHGGEISFVESLDTFAKNLTDTEPTIFFGVPRIWVKLMQGVQKRLGGRWLSNVLLNTPILGGALKKKIIQGMGFGKLKYAISAAAAISPEVIHWFKNLGVDIYEVYGLSETSGISNMNSPDGIKIGSVGRAIPESDIRLSEDGEVLIRSPNVMDGYYNAPDLTDIAIQDGWFRTGDLGVIDEEGYLSITGRAKEIFKSAKGKYISPTPIEAHLQPALAVEQLIVTGAELPQPVAIAVIIDETIWQDRKTAQKKLQKIVQEVNVRLEPHERLSHLLIVKREWDIERGLMTPTLKLRRQQIEDLYKLDIKNLHKNKPIVWIEEN